MMLTIYDHLPTSFDATHIYVNFVDEKASLNSLRISPSLHSARLFHHSL